MIIEGEDGVMTIAQPVPCSSTGCTGFKEKGSICMVCHRAKDADRKKKTRNAQKMAVVPMATQSNTVSKPVTPKQHQLPKSTKRVSPTQMHSSSSKRTCTSESVGGNVTNIYNIGKVENLYAGPSTFVEGDVNIGCKVDNSKHETNVRFDVQAAVDGVQSNKTLKAFADAYEANVKLRLKNAYNGSTALAGAPLPTIDARGRVIVRGKLILREDAPPATWAVYNLLSDIFLDVRSVLTIACFSDKSVMAYVKEMLVSTFAVFPEDDEEQAKRRGKKKDDVEDKKIMVLDIKKMGGQDFNKAFVLKTVIRVCLFVSVRMEEAGLTMCWSQHCALMWYLLSIVQVMANLSVGDKYLKALFNSIVDLMKHSDPRDQCIEGAGCHKLSAWRSAAKLRGIPQPEAKDETEEQKASRDVTCGPYTGCGRRPSFYFEHVSEQIIWCKQRGLEWSEDEWKRGQEMKMLMPATDEEEKKEMIDDMVVPKPVLGPPAPNPKKIRFQPEHEMKEIGSRAASPPPKNEKPRKSVFDSELGVYELLLRAACKKLQRDHGVDVDMTEYDAKFRLEDGLEELERQINKARGAGWKEPEDADTDEDEVKDEVKDDVKDDVKEEEEEEDSLFVHHMEAGPGSYASVDGAVEAVKEYLERVVKDADVDLFNFSVDGYRLAEVLPWVDDVYKEVKRKVHGTSKKRHDLIQLVHCVIDISDQLNVPEANTHVVRLLKWACNKDAEIKKHFKKEYAYFVEAKM